MIVIFDGAVDDPDMDKVLSRISHEDRVDQTRSCVDKRFTISAAAVERVIPPAALS